MNVLQPTCPEEKEGCWTRSGRHGCPCHQLKPGRSQDIGQGGTLHRLQEPRDAATRDNEDVLHPEHAGLKSSACLVRSPNLTIAAPSYGRTLVPAVCALAKVHANA